MLLLTATTHTLGLDTSTTSEIVYTASYVDITTTTFTPSSSSGSITTVTDTTLVSAPGSSTQRQVKYISFYNADASVSNVLTVYKKISSTEYPILKIELAAGATLEYVDGKGFKLFSTTSGGGGAVDSVNGQTGVVVLDADDIDDTATTNKFVTAADITKLGNTSGTNSGDQNLFRTIAVSGQSDVVADSATDTLTLVAGSNITLTTNATTDTVTISASGGGSQTPWTSDIETAGYKLVNATTSDGVILEATTKIVINTPALEVRSTSAGQAGNIYIYEGTSYGTNSISLKAPNILAADWVMTLPPDNGNSGEFLQTDGAGNTIWAAGGGGVSDGTYGAVTVSSGGTVWTVGSGSTGSGNNVLATSPTLVTPNLGTPSAITLTNAGGLPLATGVTGVLPVANGGTGLSSVSALLVQKQSASTASYTSTTTQIPFDNTTPQNTEGAQVNSLSYTPLSASNILVITVLQNVNVAQTCNVTCGLFSGGSGAISAASQSITNTYNSQFTLKHVMTAGTTSAISFTVRAGANVAGTCYFNGTSAGAVLNGTMYSTIIIEEFTA